MTADGIKAIAALDDELRRGMYAFIRTAGRPVTRDEAAESVGISRKLAAFHLDKLVAAGLLQARYQRAGRVGRAPKVYEPAEADIQVAIPQRQHGLLAEVLLDAVVTHDAGEAAMRAASRRGKHLGAQERERVKLGRLGAERALTVTEGILAQQGFEVNRESPTCVRLRDCPFHPVTAQAPDLVCKINQAYLAGFLDGLEAPTVQAVLERVPGACCVCLRAAQSGDQ
ncbi:putative ArsR family transcriptional regulator [Kibdelosporangium banguiense]|uniref:ArsR family transcriptional regulator n=1 Tax=Kibdelosporangium banguiense TaxID=1365924 RepID=A0ABS4U377_9PSEU|nr:transcriptional regulator [Kibdelosporangium banguiense]MBP2331075.1 putative ArsR family transcriptional regulator [Kibdelosporangium banguiense]